MGTMGRMHAPGKGISQSALPYRRSVPQWLKLTSDEVKDQIYKLAKKGLTPSQIGVILRDSHGVAQVRFITGNKILRILKGKGMAPALPEDCYYLIKKAVPSESILRGTGRTRMPSSDLFLSNPESTDWQDTTRLRESCHQHGSTTAPPPQPWWLKHHLSASWNLLVTSRHPSSTCCSSVQLI